jgi:twitching motility protein PilT
MQTFDQHLADLVHEGEVTFETAMAAATNPSDFELKMRMFRHVAKQPDAAETSVDAALSPADAAANAGMDGISQGAGAFDFLNS